MRKKFRSGTRYDDGILGSTGGSIYVNLGKTYVNKYELRHILVVRARVISTMREKPMSGEREEVISEMIHGVFIRD